MNRALPLLSLLLACGGGDPDPCDTLCEEAGFDGVEVVATEGGETCTCSNPSGLGGVLDLDDCVAYCESVGGSEEGTTLSTTETADDTCSCDY